MLQSSHLAVTGTSFGLPDVDPEECRIKTISSPDVGLLTSGSGDCSTARPRKSTAGKVETSSPTETVIAVSWIRPFALASLRSSLTTVLLVK
jgi:hypothetical protein